MNISKALLKYGYYYFSLEILEYCSVEYLLIREKHYWDLLKPEYNIAKEPGAPMSGRNHSEETKQIMSEAKKGLTGENHPRFGKIIAMNLKK
jgi:group I intron endonuclease